MESKSKRFRVNVASTVKGVLTFDATCETEGYGMSEVLACSDALVAELKARYPLAEPKPEKEGK